MATAHTVLAMVAAAQGRRDELTEHYDIALDHAQKAGDVLGHPHPLEPRVAPRRGG